MTASTTTDDARDDGHQRADGERDRRRQGHRERDPQRARFGHG